MKKRNEKRILLFLLGFGLLSFMNILRKPPIKDWLIIFLVKGYISSILDKFVVKKGYIKYPLKLIKIFDTSFIFDYLLFPITCVYYNLATYQKNFKTILIRVLYFSVPMTMVEQWLERKTNLIEYRKGWSWVFTFISLNITFLMVRGIISLVRVQAESEDSKFQEY
ncbi:CBO0543 family protein [Rossellomorea vietnamensis]|uniref:CBO0543 family protein n=1 Tax=Rossellomorea vietnamensis TaxID=218284 RepID=UPI003CFB0049